MFRLASVIEAFSALPRGPSTTFGGPPPHASRREDKDAAVFILLPYREAMGEGAAR